MRFSSSISCLILMALVLVDQGFAQTIDKTETQQVKQLAKQMAQATKSGDYKKIIGLTYDKVVENLGGQEKALETVQQQMEGLKQQGVKITQFQVRDPKPMVNSTDHQFVLLPTQTTMEIGNVTVQMDSYLLGISADQGKTWKFVDGAGLASEDQQKKILPPLPEKFQLPAPKQPKIQRDNKSRDDQ